MTTKEQMTEQLGWHCLQKGKAHLLIISEFFIVSVKQWEKFKLL